jgi:hypothetical protein
VPSLVGEVREQRHALTDPRQAADPVGHLAACLGTRARVRAHAELLRGHARHTARVPRASLSPGEHAVAAAKTTARTHAAAMCRRVTSGPLPLSQAHSKILPQLAGRRCDIGRGRRRTGWLYAQCAGTERASRA